MIVRRVNPLWRQLAHLVLHDGRTGRAAITTPDRYAVCAQVVCASRVSSDRLPALHWAPNAAARCVPLLWGTELGLKRLALGLIRGLSPMWLNTYVLNTRSEKKYSVSVLHIQFQPIFEYP